VASADAILDIKRDDKVIASIERTSTDGYGHRAYTITPEDRPSSPAAALVG